jgi:hypothetical protein
MRSYIASLYYFNYEAFFLFYYFIFTLATIKILFQSMCYNGQRKRGGMGETLSVPLFPLGFFSALFSADRYRVLSMLYH